MTYTIFNFLVFDRPDLHHYTAHAMFADIIPTYLDADRFVDSREHLSAALNPQEYKRFAEIAILHPDSKIWLKGYQEPYGPKVLSGEMIFNATLICQRCLEPFNFNRRGLIAWGLVHSESAMRALDPRLDPVFVMDGQINLRETIEDELMLLLPLIPVHTQCDNLSISDQQPENNSTSQSRIGF